MLIYMVRHGQTDWNAESRFQGQKDIPLNALGRAQASGNGLALKEILGDQIDRFDFVASPLGRTRETMERLRSSIGLEPNLYNTDERLLEVCFGDWEGFTTRELRKLYPEKVAARIADKWGFIPPGQGAESYEILSWRVGSWLASVTRPTVCVSHGGVMRSVLKMVGGVTPEEACGLHIAQDRILRVDRDAGEVRWLDPES